MENRNPPNHPTLSSPSRCEHNNPHTFVVAREQRDGRQLMICPVCRRFAGYRFPHSGKKTAGGDRLLS